MVYDRSIFLIVGLSVAAAILIALVVAFLIRRAKKDKHFQDALANLERAKLLRHASFDEYAALAEKQAIDKNPKEREAIREAYKEALQRRRREDGSVSKRA